MGNKLEHLKLIQAVISRLAGNSFQLKGWSVTLIAAVFAIVASKTNYDYVVFIAYFPLLMFWGLDGYFLRQERLYRHLYDYVRAELKDEEVDYSMNTTSVASNTPGWFAACFSVTIISFYGTMLLIVVVITIAVIMLSML